jgi:hypothetical protein
MLANNPQLQTRFFVFKLDQPEPNYIQLIPDKALCCARNSLRLFLKALPMKVGLTMDAQPQWMG